jgi:SAM-dependent methyltransferase
MVCRICNSSENSNTSFVNDKMFSGTEKFEYFECSDCGTLQISAFPKDMSLYYPENYYSLKSDLKWKDIFIQKLRDYVFYLDFPQFLVKKLSVKIPNLALQAFLKIKPNKSAKVLDVGCGEGKFLKSIFGLGFKNVVGIDPFALKTIEKPFPIIKKSLEEILEKFDVITFNHVFEHIENVHETLQKCSQQLNDKGKIIIRIPVKDSDAFENYGENWVQWDAPRHFHLLTKKAIEILAKKNNFLIYSYYNDSYKLQFTGSEKYVRKLTYQTSNAIFSSSEIEKFNRKAQYLNNIEKGDQAVVVLKKL